MPDSSQKAALINGVTELLVAVLGKDPANTFVVIDEVDTEDWGIGGLPVEEYRRQRRWRSSPSRPAGCSTCCTTTARTE